MSGYNQKLYRLPFIRNHGSNTVTVINCNKSTPITKHCTSFQRKKKIVKNTGETSDCARTQTRTKGERSQSSKRLVKNLKPHFLCQNKRETTKQNHESKLTMFIQVKIWHDSKLSTTFCFEFIGAASEYPALTKLKKKKNTTTSELRKKTH